MIPRCFAWLLPPATCYFQGVVDRTNSDTTDYNTAVGITQVTAAVRNPAKPERFWEGLFLVDTGAVDCLVPGKHLKKLGLKPRGRRTYALADGTEVTFKVTVAEVEFMGETVGATVIYGPDDAEPILGVTALESVGIEVDPRSQRLKRWPAVRLMSLAGRRPHRRPSTPLVSSTKKRRAAAGRC